jgi:hypothetical protein
MPAFEQVPEFVYMVQSSFSDPEREEDWNIWYDTVHLPRILAMDGFISAHRLRHMGEERDLYLTIYHLTGPEALETAEYLALPGWGEWRPYIRDWRRVLYRLSADLGEKGRAAQT